MLEIKHLSYKKGATKYGPDRDMNKFRGAQFLFLQVVRVYCRSQTTSSRTTFQEYIMEWAQLSFANGTTLLTRRNNQEHPRRALQTGLDSLHAALIYQIENQSLCSEEAGYPEQQLNIEWGHPMGLGIHLPWNITRQGNNMKTKYSVDNWRNERKVIHPLLALEHQNNAD